MLCKKSLKVNFLRSLLLALLLFTSQNYAQQEERNLQPQLVRNQSLFPLQSTGIWTEMHPLIPRVDYWGVYFVNADTGWAVGEGGAIIKTTNSGEKWIWYESGIENTLRTVASVNNGQRVIAAGDGGIILISEDAGETWNILPSGTTDNIWNIQMIINEIGWMVGEGGTALKTTDGGLNWIQQPMPYPTAPYWDVSFFNTEIGYICSSSGIVLKTTNGGGYWIIQQAGDTRSLWTICAIDTLRASGGGFAGKLVYTTDGGSSWLSATGASVDVNKIKFINNNKGFLASTGGFYKSINGGISWSRIDDLKQAGSAAFTTNISFPSEEKGFVSGGKMLLAKSTNQGENWRRTIVNADLIDVYFKDEQNGFINSANLIYTTNDGGQTLDTLLTFPYNEIHSMSAMAFSDSFKGFIGTTSLRIYKTTNSGLNWYRTNVIGLTDTIGTISKIFFINSNLGFTALFTPLNGKLLKTSDGGENWYIVLTAPLTSFYGISCSNDSTIWAVGTNSYPFEIYKSTDTGETWLPITVNFMDMNDVYFKDSLLGWILSSNKLYRTTDGGNTWIQDTQISAFTSRFKKISKTHFIITWNIYESVDTGNTWINITSDVGTSFLNLHAPFDYFCVPIGVRGLVINYLDTTIIPVELTGFKAELQNLNVLLSWQTITEQNNYGFELQRSVNKNSWEIIGFIKGNGTTVERQNYLFEDDNIENQVYFYRLKQIDYDGSFEYSNTIEVLIDSPSGFSLSQNYPNPFNSTTNITFQIPSDEFVSLKIYDVLGNEIKTLVQENKKSGYYSLTFSANDLGSGIYFYKLTAGENSSIKKFLLLK